MKRLPFARRAFTLIEALVMIGILIIIAIIAFANFFGGKSQTDLNSATSQVAASARQAESQAMAQSGDVVWGIHFANATNTAPYYAIFTGSSYASGTVQNHYPLPPTVAYVTSTLPVGSSEDVTFSQVTGAASVSTTIGLYLISNPSDVQDIAISGIGQVSVGSFTSCSGINNWQISAFPVNITQQPAVINNGYLYSIGGWKLGGSTSTVYYTKISATGALSAWLSTTPLPAPLGLQSAVVNNGYLYSLGGSGSSQTSTVLYTQINGANGQLGAWSSTTRFPTTLTGENVFVNNGYMYSVGGDANFNPTSTVLYTQINGANGQLGAWSSTTPLPFSVDSFAATMGNGYIYVVGGDANSGHPTSTVVYAQINSANGTIGPWLSTTPLPTAIDNRPAVVNNNYVYSIGAASSVYIGSLCR